MKPEDDLAGQQIAMTSAAIGGAIVLIVIALGALVDIAVGLVLGSFAVATGFLMALNLRDRT